jgi:NAD(P)H-dependent FMN reductase
VASPRKDGLTSRVAGAVLAGAAGAGAEVETMFLADHDIAPCRGCTGATCWDTGECAFDPDAASRSRALASADALVFATPVYMHDVCALAKCFIDKVRVPPRGGRFGPFLPTNGKPALGISVAGGTGKGALTALQGIYYGLFFICGYRGMQPMPVTRFDLDRALIEAGPRGRGLAQAARNPAPFRDTGLADRMAYYQAIPLANADAVDDNLYLARLLVSDLGRRKQIAEYRAADEALRRAEKLVESGQKFAAADLVWRAYQLALEIWEKDHPAAPVAGRGAAPGAGEQGAEPSKTGS